MSIKNILSNLLIEQDENLVVISPAEYLRVLNDVGGVASQVADLKPYKGKGIVIDGDLDLRNFKNVGPLNGIVRVKGDLNISNTNVPYIKGISIYGYLSKHGSYMWKKETQTEFNEKIEYLNKLRINDEFNDNYGEYDSEKIKALYAFLKRSGMVGMTVDNKGNKVLEDEYFIYPEDVGEYFFGDRYQWLGGNNPFNTVIYDVYTEYEADNAADNAVKSMIEQKGYDAFQSWVWNKSIDKELWGRWLYDFYSEPIYDDPESYEVPLTLSTTQKAQVNKFEKSIEALNVKLTSGNISEDEKNIIIKKIEGFENIIENIEEDPEGDYDEDYIEEITLQYVEDFIDNFGAFIDDFGFEDNEEFIMRFVDIDEVANTVIETNGYGALLDSYNGKGGQIEVDGENYYIMRIRHQ
jgi:hypothetical protein